MTDIAKLYDIDLLSETAWEYRERAIARSTKVGAALFATNGMLFGGCNIAHPFGADVHAEVNVLSSMVAENAGKAEIILIAAEREFFTPCGSCVDWLITLGGPDTVVYAENEPGKVFGSWTVEQLMPFYPF